MGTTAKIGIAEYLNYAAPSGYRDELIEGEIVLSPDPKPLHEDIVLNLLHAFEQAVKGTQFLVRSRTNSILREDESMPSPDVFVIDRQRWISARNANSYPEGSPQIAIEVYSPANRPGLLRKKIQLYLKNGALAVWIVYPETQTVVVHDVSDRIVEYRSGERIPLPEALSEIPIAVELIFQLEQ